MCNAHTAPIPFTLFKCISERQGWEKIFWLCKSNQPTCSSILSCLSSAASTASKNSSSLIRLFGPSCDKSKCGQHYTVKYTILHSILHILCENPAKTAKQGFYSKDISFQALSRDFSEQISCISLCTILELILGWVNMAHCAGLYHFYIKSTSSFTFLN